VFRKETQDGSFSPSRVPGGAPWLLIPPGGGGIGSDSNVEKKGV